jgi:hypothetical protein
MNEGMTFFSLCKQSHRGDFVNNVSLVKSGNTSLQVRALEVRLSADLSSVTQFNPFQIKVK